VRESENNFIFKRELLENNMENEKQDNGYKKYLRIVGASVVLVLGIALVLFWWSDVVGLFKGLAGFLLALGGMFALYALSK